MDIYIPLSTEEDNNGFIDYLLNKNKVEYICLNGSNHRSALDHLVNFLTEFSLWNRRDEIIYMKHKVGFIPDQLPYTNASYLIDFYKIYHGQKLIC